MSGLVNGLQNRLRRFESARHLHRNPRHANCKSGFFYANTLLSPDADIVIMKKNNDSSMQNNKKSITFADRKRKQ